MRKTKLFLPQVIKSARVMKKAGKESYVINAYIYMCVYIYVYYLYLYKYRFCL